MTRRCRACGRCALWSQTSASSSSSAPGSSNSLARGCLQRRRRGPSRPPRRCEARLRRALRRRCSRRLPRRPCLARCGARGKPAAGERLTAVPRLRMDEAALRRGEYSYGPVPLPAAVVPALSKASGECEWRAWPAGGGDGPLFTWRGSYDATRRPWYQHAARHGTGWIVYADPVFPEERMRSFVSPLMGSDGALAGVLLAGSFAA
mmetsp:Transcript_35879/g.115807  ORF Transcript_35879/g.115807 Transcript_35879/m.115807 type:complete len:206 (+) Transcript_35879:271-888(+)